MNIHIIRLLLGIAAAQPLVVPAYANGGISIIEAWSRATPGAAAVGVVYLTISDQGAADVLMGEGTTSIADKVELHETKTVSGVTSMEPVASLPIASNQVIELAPGGYHMMLVGLKQKLKPGDRFSVTLRFQHAGDVTTSVAVRTIGATAPHSEVSGSDMSGMDMGNMK